MIELVSLQLKNEGFNLKRAHHDFERKHADGITDSFQIICLNAKPGFCVYPEVGMRFELVEQIFHRTSGWDRKSAKRTGTIGNSVGAILARSYQDCSFLLETEAQVCPVAENIVKVFYEFALPYYQKFHSLQSIDLELNSHPTERTRHRGSGWLRCSTGAIVARLVGRPDYAQLVEIYRGVMSTVDRGFYLPKFEALIKDLESVQPIQTGDNATTQTT